MATFGRDRGIRMRGGRVFKPGVLTRYSRYDYNFSVVLGDHDEDITQDGGLQGVFTSVVDNDDDFVIRTWEEI